MPACLCGLPWGDKPKSSEADTEAAKDQKQPEQPRKKLDADELKQVETMVSAISSMLGFDFGAMVQKHLPTPAPK